jgi:glyoxylase-like metal-dependent hydrolase (beta-lactamase superfamily II)
MLPLARDAHVVRLNRRHFLVASAAAMALPALGRPAFALATEAHTFTQGETEITVISDGVLNLPTGILYPSAPKEELDAELTAAFGSVPETFEAGVNIVLLKSGSDLVMIDTGPGGSFGPTAGKILENLKLNGIDTAAITKVVFTHAHGDHLFGVGTDAGLNFPNAAYMIGAAEHAFWTDPATAANAPEQMKAMAEGAAKWLGAIAERTTLLKGGDSIAPGISLLDTPGHTPGHMSVVVEGGEGLILTGDAITTMVGFARPDWAFGFDADGATAATSRRALLDRAAADGHMILGYHFPFPGIGRVEAKDGVYRFAPDAA